MIKQLKEAALGRNCLAVSGFSSLTVAMALCILRIPTVQLNPFVKDVNPEALKLIRLLDHSMTKLNANELASLQKWRQEAAVKRAVIAPGSTRSNRLWKASGWGELSKQLQAWGYEVLIIGSKADQDLCRDILARGSGREKNLAGETSLLDTYRILLASRGFIGVDSGIGHIAGMLGVPALILFGPEDPDKWCPVGPRVSVIRKNLPCAPCLKDTCRFTENKCLAQITVEDVLNLVEREINGGGHEDERE